MKQFPIVASVMTQVKFSESRLENYFNKTPQDKKELGQKFSEDLVNIDCRSVHAVANGSVQLVFAGDENSVRICVDIPTTTYFLVTGIKTVNERYKLTFAVSMS